MKSRALASSRPAHAAWARSVASGRSSRPPAGFTLIELLVVLVLAALLVAVAVPNLDRLYASAARNTERDHILDQLSALGREAAARRRAYAVVGTEGAEGREAPAAPPGFEPYPLEVPPGWRVRVRDPVLARSTGVCLGGELALLHSDLPPIRLRLEAPFCRVPSGRS